MNRCRLEKILESHRATVDCATMDKMMTSFYYKETSAYKLLGTDKQPPVPLPKIYGISKFCIIMEDMSER